MVQIQSRLDSLRNSSRRLLLRHALLVPDLFIVPDAAADERFADNPLVNRRARHPLLCRGAVIDSGRSRSGDTLYYRPRAAAIDRIPEAGVTGLERAGDDATGTASSDTPARRK